MLIMMVILMIAFNCQALNWKPHSDGWLGGLKMPGEDVMTMVVILRCSSIHRSRDIQEDEQKAGRVKINS